MRAGVARKKAGLNQHARLEPPGYQEQCDCSVLNIPYIVDGTAESDSMTKTMTLNVRLGGLLGEFVATNVGETGSYENVSEYVRDLIRKDMARSERAAFDRLKAELDRGFAAPDSAYVALTADDVIARNQARRRTA
jgi:putative addiction module CopG family antidote